MNHHLATVWAWALANPAITWPIVTALITVLLKPRSPAAYARLASRKPEWLFSRIAMLLQLIGALGLDPVKAVKVLQKLAGGKGPPAGPSVLLAGTFVCATALTGCTPLARAAFAELLAKKIACGVAHQNLEPQEMAAVCALQEGDLPLVLQAVGEARAASAREVAQATARAGAAKCSKP